jgi:hypothetical protein
VQRLPPILLAGVRFSIAGAAMQTTAEHEIDPAD